MKRLMTSTCLAAAFAVGLAAQTAGTAGTQDPPGGGQGRGGPRPVTATGCLRAGDTAGTYQLTDVQMQGGGGRRGGDTGAASGTATGEQRGRGNAPTTLMLNAASDVDLKPHVGHKIEVTGTMMGGRRGGDAGAGSGTGTGSGGGTTASGGQGRGGMRNVTVTSVRMVSESCS